MKLNQRQHGEIQEIPFLKGGQAAEALLSRLVADDEVADLPRVNALATLCSMQFRAIDVATLETRDRTGCMRLMLQLLTSGRLRVRTAAAFQIVRFMRLSTLHRTTVPAEAAINDALAQAIHAHSLPGGTAKYVEWWLSGGGRPTIG